MTWTLVLAARRRRLRVQGARARHHRRAPAAAVVERCLALIPAALFAALVVKDTFSVGQELQVDARAAGVAAAVDRGVAPSRRSWS